MRVVSCEGFGVQIETIGRTMDETDASRAAVFSSAANAARVHRCEQSLLKGAEKMETSTAQPFASGNRRDASPQIRSTLFSANAESVSQFEVSVVLDERYVWD